jgi:hypothetical protein
MTRATLDAIGLELELLDGAEVTRWDGGLLQFSPPVEIGLWYGDGQTLQRWRAGAESAWPGVTFAAERDEALCGAAARVIEARIPAGEAAEGGFTTPEGGLELRTQQAPAKTAVVAAFVHRGTPILLSWTVAADRREALRAAEERFFASLSCA